MAKMLRQIDDEALERPFNKAQFIRLLKYMVPYKKNVIIAPTTASTTMPIML